MKAIIFINTTKSGTPREAIRAADELHYYTILITNNKRHILKRDEYPDVHNMIYVKKLNFDSITKQIDKLKFLKIETILSFVDSYVTLTSTLRDYYSINNQNTNAIRIMENKLLTREILKEESFTPNFISSDKIDKNSKYLNFPMIYKKLNSTASKGVALINSLDEIKSKEKFILEEYLHGQQFIIEVYVKDHQIVNIIKVKQYLHKNTFVITGYVLEENLRVTDEEYDMLYTIINKLEFSNGAFHIEYKLTEKGLQLIEINPRVAGGGMNDLLYYACGKNYIKEVVKDNLNLKADFNMKVKTKIFGYYLTSQKAGKLKRISGRTQVRKIDSVKYLYIKPRKDNKINTPKSMGHRLGYVITTGNTIEDAIKTALEADKKIKFEIKEDSND